MKKSIFISFSFLLILLSAHALIAQNKSSYPVNFNKDKFKEQTLTLNGKTFEVRAFKNIIYVKNHSTLLIRK